MSLIVFTMINLVGDPVDMLVNPESLPEEIERVRSDFGLDKPIHIQYWKFLKGALSGDLGNSFIFGRPALTLISERFPATLELWYFYSNFLVRFDDDNSFFCFTWLASSVW